VDKHKVLQILVNLLSNAKYACDEGGPAEKRVTVRIAPAAGDRVKIEVADSGIGIAPENLARIFGHGFTTRPSGHGFGLHSGALAAKELGGTLTVTSPGSGQGATFVLELPLVPPESNR
jgi:signal transduction histidine kinase